MPAVILKISFCIHCFETLLCVLSKCTKDLSSTSEPMDLSSFYGCTISHSMDAPHTLSTIVLLVSFQVISLYPYYSTKRCTPFPFSGLPWLSLGSTCWLLEQPWLDSFQTAGDVFPLTAANGIVLLLAISTKRIFVNIYVQYQIYGLNTLVKILLTSYSQTCFHVSPKKLYFQREEKEKKENDGRTSGKRESYNIVSLIRLRPKKLQLISIRNLSGGPSREGAIFLQHVLSASMRL